MTLLTIELFAVNASLTVISPWISFIGSTIMAMVVKFSLLTRVSALWSHHGLVVWFARLLFTLNALCQIIILAYNYTIAILLPNNPPFTGCLVIPTFPKLYLIFIGGITYDTCMFILTVIRSYPVARTQGMKVSLWTLLLRDGLVFYLCVIAAHILSIIAILAPVDISISTPIMMSYPPIAVVGIACNRLFIRLEMLLQGIMDEDDSMDTVSARIFSNNDLKRARQAPRAFQYNGKKRDVDDPLSTELSNL
ncbi:hypothetical protein CPB86DRAFT_786501 [Serendipita vermifera]|nr:hypothetical protein CPB86DRAFT_786501 [Serendipita vermifera]